MFGALIAAAIKAAAAVAGKAVAGAAGKAVAGAAGAAGKAAGAAKAVAGAAKAAGAAGKAAGAAGKIAANQGIKAVTKKAGVNAATRKAVTSAGKKAVLAKKKSFMSKAVKAATSMAGNTNAGQVVQGGQEMIKTAKGPGTPLQKGMEMGEQAVETIGQLQGTGDEPPHEGLEQAQGQGDAGQPPRTVPYFMVQDKQTGQNRVKDFGDYFEEYMNG